MLPFPNVPCSLTPPQSPVTIASCGDLLLPSSQYDAVGLRVTIITRLNRFTCVTARPSLVPTLNSCRYLHEPRARFSVGRLVPLSEAGISPAGSIRLFLTHHIGDAALCVPKTLSEWMTRWNQLGWRKDRAALFRSGRRGITIQVEDRLVNVFPP
jgi:hypothetical protein